jgi:hypothetical protein
MVSSSGSLDSPKDAGTVGEIAKAAADRVREAKRLAAEEGRENMEELFRSMAKRSRQANLSF